MDLPPNMVIIESDGRAVRLAFQGRRRWALWDASTPEGSGHGLSNEDVPAAVLQALDLEGDLPYDSRRIAVTTAMGSGYVRNNTFPTSLWIYNAPNATGIGTLEGCLWSLLCALELRPPAAASPTPPPDLSSFSRARLLTSAEPETFCLELEGTVNGWLQASLLPSDAVRSVVEALQDAGHALVQLDSDGSRFEVWAGHGRDGRQEPSLVVELTCEPYEPASCSVRLG